MRMLMVTTLVMLTVLLIALCDISAQPIQGTIGSSPQWGSGWIDFSTPVDFKKGDHLRITVGGTATKILLRFVPKGCDPNTPCGIDGGVREVPANRILDVKLESEHPQVTQISVHGKSRAWDFYLGGDNGPATLVAVDRVRP
jgi:hypothetical protein